MEKTRQRFSDKMFLTLCQHALGKHFSLLNYSIAGWLEHFSLLNYSIAGWLEHFSLLNYSIASWLEHFSLLNYSIAGWLEHLLFLIFIFSNSGWNMLKHCLSSVWCIRTLILWKKKRRLFDHFENVSKGSIYFYFIKFLNTLLFNLILISLDVYSI